MNRKEISQDNNIHFLTDKSKGSIFHRAFLYMNIWVKFYIVTYINLYYLLMRKF